jgi:hypothetical protein
MTILCDNTPQIVNKTKRGSVMKKLSIILVVIVFGIIGVSSDAAAQFDREFDPVIVLGSECGDLLSLTAADVRVYAFTLNTGVWAPIPFQIDDFKVDNNSDSGKKVEWDGNGLIDGVDEIVFMAKDLGDKAADATVWPDDMQSQNYTRYEVVVSDAVSGEDRYAYIYYSSTLAISSTSYISYDNDVVSGTSYAIGHDTDDAGGLPDSLSIVGSNVDVLDGWRVRAHINKIVIEADLGFGAVEFTGRDIDFSENMNENIELKYGFITVTVNAKAFHDVAALKAKFGAIRVIREHAMAIKFETTGLVDTSRIPITTIYYDKSVEFEPAFSLNLGDDVKELESDYISFSSGLDQSSMNFKFYGGDPFLSGTSTQDLLIDGDPLNIIFKNELSETDWPGKHWFGFTGQQSSAVNNASFITIANLNGVRIAPSRTPALYHYDYKTDDGDDNGVYGISGLRIYDWSSAYSTNFDIDALFRKFYLAKNSTDIEMQALFDQYSVPLQVASLKQNFLDEVAPAIIADLSITGRTDTSAVLSWTAVGDDGTENGPARFYVIRYSTVAPANPDGSDWAWWGAATTKSALGVPIPAEPEVTETFEITGLEEANVYYFRINVVDDAGNASGLSNTAAGNTTPVELVSFDALVTDTKNVLLKWATASETNNLGFSIERKIANADEWREVGFVKGAGTTAKDQSYTFIDSPENIGDWAYRLKQVDADGSIEYSDPINVSIAAPQEFALKQNYPNPFNPGTTISFQIPESVQSATTLVIYDMLGRKVRTLINENINAGYYDIPWDGYNDAGAFTASGIYIYYLRMGEFSSARKMVKMQ